jgi:hypothetical protein
MESARLKEVLPMTDDMTTPTPQGDPEPGFDAVLPPTEAPPAGPSANEAWADVVARMGDLGDAISAWAKAAADSPDNRRHLDELRQGINDMAGKAEGAFEQVTSGDFGQQVKAGAAEAGEAIGDAAQKMSAAAAPHVASAFAGLAGAFGRAAHKVDEAVSRQTAQPAQTAAPAPDAPDTPTPPVAPQPPASDE